MALGPLLDWQPQPSETAGNICGQIPVDTTDSSPLLSRRGGQKKPCRSKILDGSALWVEVDRVVRRSEPSDGVREVMT
jgi:hypothetical protein